MMSLPGQHTVVYMACFTLDTIIRMKGIAQGFPGDIISKEEKASEVICTLALKLAI
jgi:hypothetical protein